MKSTTEARISHPTTATLMVLVEADLPAFRSEIARLNREEPARFHRLVEEFGLALAASNEAEDKISGTPRPPAAYVRRHSSIAGLMLGMPKGA